MKQKASDKPLSFVRGIAVAHEKRTAHTESVRMPIPPIVTVPMQMHIGAPCQPTVKVGDEVLVGQKIGDSEQFVSAPIHAPVSGRVKEIRPVPLGGGNLSTAIIIESDGNMTPAPLTPPHCRKCGGSGARGA